MYNIAAKQSTRAWIFKFGFRVTLCVESKMQDEVRFRNFILKRQQGLKYAKLYNIRIERIISGRNLFNGLGWLSQGEICANMYSKRTKSIERYKMVQQIVLSDK